MQQGRVHYVTCNRSALLNPSPNRRPVSTPTRRLVCERDLVPCLCVRARRWRRRPASWLPLTLTPWRLAHWCSGPFKCSCRSTTLPAPHPPYLPDTSHRAHSSRVHRWLHWSCTCCCDSVFRTVLWYCRPGTWRVPGPGCLATPSDPAAVFTTPGLPVTPAIPRRCGRGASKRWCQY